MCLLYQLNCLVFFFQLSNYLRPSIGALMFTFRENVTVSLSSQDHETPKKCINCFEFFFNFLLSIKQSRMLSQTRWNTQAQFITLEHLVSISDIVLDQKKLNKRLKKHHQQQDVRTTDKSYNTSNVRYQK